MINRTGIILLFTLFVLITAGCSTTRRLADGEMLYTGVKKMDIESLTGDDVSGNVRAAVEEPLSVKPNNPLWSPYVRTPFPVGLWVYNKFYTTRRTGFKAWLFRNLGKKPVLISDVQPELRVQMIEDILDNHGYFGSSAEYEIILKRNPRKARISYKVGVARPWVYGTVEYPAPANPLARAIDSLQASSGLRTGERYDADSLAAERIRITNILRERSYYYFRPDYIEYLADTTREHLTADIRMILSQGTPPAAMKAYDTGEVNIRLYSSSGTGDAKTYAIADNINVWYQEPLKVRRKVLERAIAIKPGQPSRVSDMGRTLNNLTKLGIFRYVDLGVTPLDLMAGRDVIDMTLTAAMDTPMDAELEVDFASKSNSFIGPGAIFSVKHKNIFHGGEILALKLNGAYEWQTGNTGSQLNASTINSYELGISSSLIFPRLLVPGFIPRPVRYDSKTTIQVGASLMNRPKFFRMLSFSGSESFDFQTSASSYHNLTILKLVYNRMLSTTHNFDSTMNQNPAIKMSFQDQFIPSASYTYTFDREMGGDRIIWQSTVTTAGNILAGAYSLSGSKGTKNIFGNRFSQFVKGTTEIKYYKKVGRNNTLAMRLSVGAGHAYGNSEVLPYNEQFYIGGANSIRAFTIRSIGPGSYRPDESNRYGYFDQTGDFRLEANLEFRFRIMGGLNGAIFFDAGNIWTLEDDPGRPGAKLDLKHFGERLATGTGAGLRYDLSFLVIRADLGIGIHTPFENPEKKGYYNIPKFKDGLGFHLAIGYPF